MHFFVNHVYFFLLLPRRYFCWWHFLSLKSLARQRSFPSQYIWWFQVGAINSEINNNGVGGLSGCKHLSLGSMTPYFSQMTAVRLYYKHLSSAYTLLWSGDVECWHSRTQISNSLNASELWSWENWVSFQTDLCFLFVCICSLNLVDSYFQYILLWRK